MCIQIAIALHVFYAGLWLYNSLKCFYHYLLIEIRANPLKHYLISTGNTLNILLLITQREAFWIFSLICIFALAPQRYCGLNHSADYGVQYQLGEPDTRSERGPHPLIVNKYPTTLLELRIGIDLSDSKKLN